MKINDIITDSLHFDKDVKYNHMRRDWLCQEAQLLQR